MFPTPTLSHSQVFVNLTSVKLKRAGGWTTCNRKQTEKRLKYCKSRDMIRDHRASIFAKTSLCQ